MKTRYLFFIVLFFLVHPEGLFAQSFGDNKVNSLYKKVLDAAFPDEKEVFTRELGKLRSSAARKALLTLFNDSDSWNQEAAIIGLLLLNMPDVDQILIEQMPTDFMLEDDISEGIASYGARFVQPLIKEYKKAESEEHREILLETIARIKNNQAKDFLKSVVQDKKSPDRSMAFQFLIEYFKIEKEYVALFFTDQELKEYALSWLVDNGTQNDLGLFLNIINDKKENETYVIIAYEAVNKWGKYILKQQIYLEALKSNNEALARGALYIFSKVKSDVIMDQLCRLTRQAEQQDTRIIAASNLAGYKNKIAVPYMISVLKEVYIEDSEPLGIKLISTIFTFGISAILESISADMSRNEFDAQMWDIAAGLEMITGADNGTSYTEWLDWGVYHGYTVDGINIIQYLFHGNVSKRQKAYEAAYKLLGFKNKTAYLKKYPGDKTKTEKELALSLAAKLVEKGYLVDEKY